MKKILAGCLALILAMTLYLGNIAVAEDLGVYEQLVQLLNGKKLNITLNMDAGDVEEDLLPDYDGFTCVVYQEGEQILVMATGEKAGIELRFAADAKGVQLEGVPLSEPIRMTWEETKAILTVEGEESSRTMALRLTGPNQELVSFNLALSSSTLMDYEMVLSFTLISSTGVIYSLWDTLTAENGEATNEFFWAWDKGELMIEGSGTETATDADGTVTILREETDTVSLDDEEMGELKFTLTVTVE